MSVTKIPPDGILEGLYKLGIRESEKLKTVLELYDLEIHQKKLGPDYHRLKTMVKRSIEQDIRNKNFGRKKWKFMTEERRGQESREQNSVYKKFLEIVGNGSPTGSLLKETLAVSATMSNKRGKITPVNYVSDILPCTRMSEKQSRTRSPRGKSPSGRMSRWPCKDDLKGTCNNSYCVKSGTLQNACSTRPRVVVGLVKSARMHTVRLMNRRLLGPKRMMTKVQ